MTLVSGDIRFMRIFAEVPGFPGEGASNDSGLSSTQFSAFSLALTGSLAVRNAARVAVNAAG